MRPTDAPCRCTRLRISVAIAAALSGSSVAYAGPGVWTSGGPYGGSVWAMAIDATTPTTLYAGTNGGVYKSTNSGGTGAWAGTGLPSVDVLALAIDPTTPGTLYAGTYGGGVFKSTNSGGTWAAANTGLAGVYVFALAIDPTTPATLYAGTGGGVFKSTNSGGTWAAANTGLTNLAVWALAIDPSTPAALYVGTDGGGVFKSINSGGTWAAANTGLTSPFVKALAIDPSTPATLYAATGTNPGGVFKSTNSGSTWAAANNGQGDTEVWEIINITADAHPIHLHLVQFQIISRQNFDLGKYNAAYNTAFPAVPGDPVCTGGVYCPGFGPPLNYLTGNPRALGGNPDITLYLKGTVNPPLLQEQGWKDTVVAYPNQVTRLAVRWAPTSLPTNTPAADRYFPFDPYGDTHHGYVWHCHIVDHEDNEMMRPNMVPLNPLAPAPAARPLVKGVAY